MIPSHSSTNQAQPRLVDQERFRSVMSRFASGVSIITTRYEGIDYGLTSSCYDPAPDGQACGHCEACLLRLKGFEEAGVSDPLVYQGARA